MPESTSPQITLKVTCLRGTGVLRSSPCFQVAELLRDDFSQINAQTIHDPLSKIGMRGATKNLDVRHSAAN